MLADIPFIPLPQAPAPIVRHAHLRSAGASTRIAHNVTVDMGLGMPLPRVPKGCTSLRFTITPYAKSLGLTTRDFAGYACPQDSGL